MVIRPLTSDFPAVKRPSEYTPPPAGAAGRWYLAVLGLSLALLGSVFVWLMARSFLRARDMRTWPEIPCVILSSEVEEWRHDQNSPTEYRQNVVFGYEWHDSALSSELLTLRGSPWSSDRQVVERRVADFPVGSSTICHVNPAHPDRAVLKTDSLAPGYSIWFPALFVVGGLGITLRAAAGNSRRPLAGSR